MASRDIKDLSAEAAQKCEAFLAKVNGKLKPLNLEVFLTCTYRSQKEQDALYAQGRTVPGKIVTWTKKSVHTQRRAWDVAIRDTRTDKLRWDGPWDLLGQVAADLEIEWGGRWMVRDRPHFQIARSKK
jgi:peptidoglycan LD-endopeptidase CwlK